MSDITIRNATLADAPRILEIYAYYVEHTVITFEYDVPSLAEFEGRMRDIMQKYPFHEHLGFTLAGTFHNCGYKFGRWYDMIWMEKVIGEHRPDQPDIVPYQY